jgi:hypothetical protein
MMMKAVLASVVALFALATTPAQTRHDSCHVYIVDVALGKKAFEEFNETGNRDTDAKALARGQIVFPEFKPVIGEEELTTKTYRFPKSRFMITASVYYTDESMASAEGYDSMLVGIVIGPKAQRDAISVENNAVSEVTDNDNLDTVRAKKYIRVNGRLYLVGIECRCKERAKSK